MSIEAMKQALEALELLKSSPNIEIWCDGADQAITALRVAIAEASMQRLTDVQQEMEQEPVAWRHTTAMGHHYFRLKPQDPMFKPVPLYTHPPRREWVGLTDEEMRQAAQAMDAEPLAEGWKELIKFARAIEANLKEKNS